LHPSLHHSRTIYRTHPFNRRTTSQLLALILTTRVLILITRVLLTSSASSQRLLRLTAFHTPPRCKYIIRDFVVVLSESHIKGSRPTVFFYTSHTYTGAACTSPCSDLSAPESTAAPRVHIWRVYASRTVQSLYLHLQWLSCVGLRLTSHKARLSASMSRSIRQATQSSYLACVRTAYFAEFISTSFP